MKHLLSLLAIAFALCSVAHAQTTVPVLIKWAAPTAYTDGKPITAPIGYAIYAGPKGPGKTKIATAAASATASAPTGYTHAAPLGTTCYVIRAVVAGVTSDESPELCNTVVAPKPNPPGQPVLGAAHEVRFRDSRPLWAEAPSHVQPQSHLPFDARARMLVGSDDVAGTS